MKIKRLVLIALMSALFYVLDRFISLDFFFLKITFSALPIIIVSLLYGPIDGMIVGTIGAFMSQAFSQYGLTITTPLWILPATLRGIIVGFAKNKNNIVTVIFIIISAFIVTLFNTLAFYIDGVIFGYDSKALEITYLLTRIASGIACSIIYSIVSIPVVNALKKTKFLD